METVKINGEDVKTPSVLFDKENGTLLQIGEGYEVENYYRMMDKSYREVGAEIWLKDVVYMKLPKDQALIDRICNTAGYIKKVYGEYVERGGIK